MRSIQTDKLHKQSAAQRGADKAMPIGSDGMPQHLSADDPELDDVGAASADSFPASDPPSSSVPSRLG